MFAIVAAPRQFNSRCAKCVSGRWLPCTYPTAKVASGTLLTRVRKSCKGRAVLPKPAHQVIAEAEEAGAVWTKPSNSAAAESTAPTRLSPFAGLLAKRGAVDRGWVRSFFSPAPQSH